MNPCVHCGEAKTGLSTTKCDGCGGVIHHACVGLSESDTVKTRAKSRAIKVVCPKCNINLTQCAGLKDLMQTMIDTLKTEFLNAIEQLKTQFEQKLNESLSNKSNIPDDLDSETIIDELADRQSRAGNIIIYNLPESGNGASSQNDDLDGVKTILNGLEIADKDKIHTLRLGRRGANSRPLKIFLGSRSNALLVLKNKTYISEKNSGIKITNDETPMQREYKAKLRAELEQRKTAGEENLTIRYVKGKPKIVPLSPLYKKQTKN